MNEFFCVVDQAKFTTTGHLFAVLARCQHLICMRYAERLQAQHSKVTCPICFQEYLPDSYIDRQETAIRTRRLRDGEVRCCNHEKKAGEYFCVEEMKVYCEDCAHKDRDCCKNSREVDFNVEIAYHLRVEFERMQANGRLRRIVVSSSHITTAQDRYVLLRKLLDTQRSLPLCFTHHRPVTVIHPDTLLMKCSDCSKQEGCTDMNRCPGDIPCIIRTYLRTMDCYRLSKDLCKRLRNLETESLDQLLRTVEGLSLIPKEGDSPKEDLFCPKCGKDAVRLWKLPCAKAVHVLCLACAENEYTATQLVSCPLDFNQFKTFPSEYLRLSPISRTEERVAPNEQPKVQLGISQIAQLQGQPLPPPTLSGPCFKPVTRFSSVFPPVGTDIPRSMQPWYVSQDSVAIEAVSFQASAVIRVTGITLGRPVSANDTVLLEEVFLVKGTRTDGISRVKLLNKPRQITGGEVAIDIQFDTSALCQAGTFYTLRFLLKPQCESVQLFRGCHYQTQSYLQSEGVEFWYFQEPEPSADLCNGDQSRTGPVLRLFYR